MLLGRVVGCVWEGKKVRGGEGRELAEVLNRAEPQKVGTRKCGFGLDEMC